MGDWYKEVIKNGKVTVVEVPIENIQERTRWQIRETVRHPWGNCEVSTVFLQLDHGWPPGGKPILYETMVFGGPLDQECVRYETREQAIKGHEAMKRKVANPPDRRTGKDRRK